MSLEVSTNPQKIEYVTGSECGHPVEDDDNDTLTFMRAVTTPSGWAVWVKFFCKVCKTQVHLIEALDCFTKRDQWNLFGILYDIYVWEACSENINIWLMKHKIVFHELMTESPLEIHLNSHIHA